MNATADTLAASMGSPSTSPVEAAGAGRFPIGSRRQLGLAAALVAAHAIAVPAGMIATMVAFGVENPFQAGVGSLAMVALVTLLTAGGVVMGGVVRAGGMSLRDLGWRTDRLGRDIALALPGNAAAIAGILLTGIALGVTSLGDVAATIAGYSPLEHLVFCAIGLSAAFTEESLFRGYLQPGLVKRLGPTAGIVVGAAIFSLYHLNFGAASLLGKLLAGLVFGVLRHRTGSLVPGAIAHALIWIVLGAA
jgi:membrane protease YdiL (CAAX protease family)